MKNYKEMANDVIRRIDEYETSYKRKKTRTIYTVTSLCCICLIAFLGFELWQNRQFETKLPIPLKVLTDITEKDNDHENKENITSISSSNHIVSKELQEQIDKLESQSSDSLGWIVYGEKIYLQIDIDISTINPNKYLGCASEFQGFYRKQQLESQNPSNKIDGELYSVLDNPDLIFVKLDNGGIVILSSNYSEYYG